MNMALYIFAYVLILLESLGVGNTLLVLSAGYELIRVSLSSVVWKERHMYLLQRFCQS